MGKEFQRASTFFVVQRRGFITNRLRSVTPALRVRETERQHPDPDGVTQLSRKLVCHANYCTESL